jgi:hypothetical protein
VHKSLKEKSHTFPSSSGNFNQSLGHVHGRTDALNQTGLSLLAVRWANAQAFRDALFSLGRTECFYPKQLPWVLAW